MHWLLAYKSFLEWNDDPAVAGPAEKLYGSIDRLELYVGLQAEQTKPVMPGAGLCPGQFVQMTIDICTNDSVKVIPSAELSSVMP